MAIISPLPYNIVNGQAVDSTPVMADLNQIVNNVNANAAALAGSPTQVFSVANATTSSEAVPLGQAQADFAALAGISTQVFNAANGTSGNEVVNFSQFLAILATTGSVELPNGLIINWGIATTNASGVGSLTFATPFTVGAYVVFSSVGGGSAPSNYTSTTGAATKTTLPVYSAAGGTGATAQVNVLAIGE